jgi:predicted amidohydrolase
LRASAGDVSTVRIALANLRYPASRDESVLLAQEAIRQAGAQQALVVCFPECYVPGYRTANRPAPPLDMPWLELAWQAIAATAAESHVAVVLGTERFADGAPRITALVIDTDGRIIGYQDKVQLDPSEDAMYQPASERRTFTVGPLTFGIAICHEGWRYPETVRWAARRGAQLVFHPHFAEAEAESFRPTTFADPRNTFHEKAMLCRAAENSCWFASVNCASDGSPTTSAVVHPDGTVLAWHPYGQHGLLLADIDLAQATGLLAQRCRTSS